MGLNTIPKEGQWANISDRINENFSKVDVAVESLKEATVKSCGYFPTVNALQNAYPQSSAGAKAYVGSNYPYAIYLWDVDTSAWVDSGETGGDEDVNLSDYYTKSETNSIVGSIKPIVINGDVTNAPDEEDITSNDGLLKLADRSAINGMGYVILRKDKTFAEQVIKANTIYDIRYDFDLGGQEITIPEGCVLDFQGGSLSDGVVVGNFIIRDCGSVNTPLFKNVLVESNNKSYYLSWFVSEDEDAAPILNTICSKLNKCVFFDKKVQMGSTVKCASGTRIQGLVTMRNYVTIPNTFIGDCVFQCFSDKDTAINSISISDIEVSFEGEISDYCPIFLDLEYLLRGSYFQNICIKKWNNTAIRTGYHNYSDVSEAIEFSQIVVSMMTNTDRVVPVVSLTKLHESIFSNCRFFNTSNFNDETTLPDGYNGSYIVDMLNSNDVTFTNCFFGGQKGPIINVNTSKNHLCSGVRFINNTFENIYRSEQGDLGVIVKAYDTNAAVIDSFYWYGNRYNYPTAKLTMALTNVLYSVVISPKFYVTATGCNGNVVLLSKNTVDNSSTNELLEYSDGKHKYIQLNKDKTFDIFRHSNYTRLTSKSLSGSTEYTASIQLGGDNIYDNRIKLFLNGEVVATFTNAGLLPNVNATGSELPTTAVTKGKMIFDANTNKPLWWDGSKWVDAAGAEV